MARQMPIQDAWQLHLLHQRQEYHKVIDTLVCNLKLFFHAPQYARKFRFCLAHYANGEFVGFTIRQFPVGKTHTGKNSYGKPLGYKTIIKPSKKAIKEHTTKVAEKI